MNPVRKHVVQLRGFGYRAALAIALVAASLWFAPAAFAHSHVRFGITVGVGNCWRCGYWASPPVYYTPAYPPPVYYGPRPVYYAPRPVYYGYSRPYYAPYRHRGSYYQRGYYHHRHDYRGRGHGHSRHGRNHHGHR